jgi:hypothetical protein
MVRSLVFGHGKGYLPKPLRLAYAITFKLVFIQNKFTSTKPMGNKMPGERVVKSALARQILYNDKFCNRGSQA